MGEIRIVGPGKTRGYPYPVCKKMLSCAWAETAHTRHVYPRVGISRSASETNVRLYLSLYLIYWSVKIKLG